MKTIRTIAAVAIMAILALSGKAQTYVSGGIYANTTWTKVNSPYIVTDTVVVFPGVTLTIQPGVVVRFDDDMMMEIRQGALIAQGTASDSITFTSNSATPTPGIYSGVYLNGGNFTSKFNYCKFNYADMGIQHLISNDSLFVRNSNFQNNNIGIKDNGLSNAFSFIDTCNFTYNSFDGLNVFGVVNFCNISNNYRNGMKGGGGGGIIKNCTILHNQNMGTYGSTIDNCYIAFNGIGSYAVDKLTNSTIEFNDTAVFLVPKMNNCIIKNNNYGIIGSYSIEIIIKNCVIDSNSNFGIQIDNFNNYNYDSVYNCRISNSAIGIEIKQKSVITKNIIENCSVGILLNNILTKIYCNKICNNTAYSIQYTKSTNLNIENNYWCTNDSAAIAAKIYDGYDNLNLGLVTFLPLDTLHCYNTTGSCYSYFTLYPDTNILHHYFLVNMASGASPINYSWDWGDGTTANGGNVSHTYNTAGTYNICLTITDGTGCTDTYCYSSYLQKGTNDMVYVNVIFPVGTNEYKNEETISVYPNPASSVISCELGVMSKGGLCKVYDIMGTEVYEKTFTGNSLHIDVSGFAKGLYLLKLNTGNAVVVKKIIVE